MRSMVQLLRTSCTCARLPLSSTRIAKAAAVTETLAAYDEGTLVVPGGVVIGRRLSLSHPPMRDGHPLPPSPSLSSSSVFLLVLSTAAAVAKAQECAAVSRASFAHSTSS